MDFSHDRYVRETEALFQRHQSVASAGFTGDAYKPGLEVMRRLDEELGRRSGLTCGRPGFTGGHSLSSCFRSVHVAGTNGKGSVCSMLAAALAGTGPDVGAVRVGLYTSPHLLDFRERMKIVEGEGFRMISEEEVLEFLDLCGEESAEASLLDGRSFFEVTTAMAFWWFAKVGVDMAVIEVGLGGRLDSTNIIVPELSVITSIGLDHCTILGNTRAAIAREKAGIFKPGVPALVWGHDPETDPVFEAVAGEVGATLVYADDSATCPEGLSLKSAAPVPDINGPCARANIRTVRAALRLLGLDADRSAAAAIFRAAAITGFHGRWERLAPGVYCDIGHNPEALRASFSKLESLRGPGPLTIVYGVMADKDFRANINLLPRNARLVLCSPDTPRALGADDLYAAVRELRPDLEAVKAGSVREAVRIARGSQGTVFITGSTYVVSEAMKEI